MGDLEQRNARAVNQALQGQESKLQRFADDLAAMRREIAMMKAEIAHLNSLKAQFLVKSHGNGPTT